MKERHARRKNLIPSFGDMVLIVFGLVGALWLAEMLLRAFPEAVPPQVRVNPPARRVKPNLDEKYELRLSDGDLFVHMRGKIAPLPPEQDEVVAQVHMVTDANGFRNFPPIRATYDIVALGDSFSRASGVAKPWSHLLSEHLQSDVLNLAEVGLGPQDELTLLQQYGLEKRPQWVIITYFEGNDLYDAGSYAQATPLILFRFGRYILDEGIAVLDGAKPDDSGDDAAATYIYPITISIQETDLEIAFFSYYISWLALDRETIELSRNYQIVQETFSKVQDLCEAAGARFVLVYAPSKEHVYLPYLTDSTHISSVYSDVPTIGLDDAGFLQFTSHRATAELAHRHMNDQSDLIAEYAAEQQILFLDLTSTFQQEASKGTELYYRFDTHWNQAGHDLAAQTIARYLEDLTKVPANQ